MSLKVVLMDFGDWTGAAGINQIAYSVNQLVRIFWIITWLILAAVGFYQAYLVIKNFFSYPMVVTTTLDYGPQDYPVITFCSSNPFIYTETLANPGPYGQINTLMTEYKALVASNYGTISPDTFGINSVSTRYEKTEWATEALVLLASKLTPTQKDLASYSFDDVIKVCSYNGIECTKNNFSSYYDATYGKCFQFNTEPSDYKTLRGGSAFGLTVLMLIQQRDANGTELFLPTTTVAGAKIGITFKGEDPAMEAYGLNAPVGKETLIGLEFSKISRLQKPYSNCIPSDAETKNYYPNATYSLDLCFRTCTQKRIYNKVGCADPRYGKPATLAYCTTSQLPKLRQLRDHQNPSNPYYFDPIKECNCMPGCSEVDIDTTVTLGTFPAEEFVVLNSKSATQGYSCATSTMFGGDQEKCNQWYYENSALINIYYDGLDFEQYSETPSYPFSSASNDLGGQLSLWLGISVISVIEFIALTAVLCMFCLYGRKVQVGPSDDDLENDHRIKHVKNLKAELDNHEHIDMQLRQRANMRQKPIDGNDGGINPAAE